MVSKSLNPIKYLLNTIQYSGHAYVAKVMIRRAKLHTITQKQIMNGHRVKKTNFSCTYSQILGSFL